MTRQFKVIGKLHHIVFNFEQSKSIHLSENFNNKLYRFCFSPINEYPLIFCPLKTSIESKQYKMHRDSLKLYR